MTPSRWPLHPHPLNEECVLSWLARIATCYKLTINDLLEHDLGFYGNPDDLNVHVPAWLLTLLSYRTGISEQQIYALTLSSWAPLLLDPLDTTEADFESYVHHHSLLLPSWTAKKFQPKQPWKPWLNTSSATVSKACPVCIDSKPVGAISLTWYLPLMLSCPIHQCLLRPCHIYQGRHVYWTNETDLLISLSPAVHTMDQRTWSALTMGQVTLPRRTIHGGIWLRLLRTVLDELHIPASSSHSLYAKNIVDIWASLGLKPRGGQARWHPYEILPPKTQQQTLIAAAMAFAKIENGSISPPGEYNFLFLPELVDTKDWPSHLQKTYSDPVVKPKPLWQEAFDSLNQLIERAKNDSVEAKNFRHFMLLGRVDFDSIQKMNKLLIDVGVPSEFLVP
jgi:hypothetical protein